LENVRITVNGDVATEVSVCTILRQAVRPIMLLGGDKTGSAPPVRQAGSRATPPRVRFVTERPKRWAAAFATRAAA